MVPALDQFEFPEGITHDTSFHNWQRWLWAFSDIDYERIHISNSKTYRDEILKNIPSEAPYPPHGNIRIDYRGIDITKRKMACYEMEWIIQRGNYTQDTINDFIAEQNEQGIDNIVVHVQAQLDELKIQSGTDD